jgi:hypothetical protein
MYRDGPGWGGHAEQYGPRRPDYAGGRLASLPDSETLVLELGY